VVPSGETSPAFKSRFWELSGVKSEKLTSEAEANGKRRIPISTIAIILRIVGAEINTKKPPA
jgi:hypothetical protein